MDSNQGAEWIKDVIEALILTHFPHGQLAGGLFMVPLVPGLFPLVLYHFGLGCLLGSTGGFSTGLAGHIDVAAPKVGAVDELSLFAVHSLIKIIILHDS